MTPTGFLLQRIFFSRSKERYLFIFHFTNSIDISSTVFTSRKFSQLVTQGSILRKFESGCRAPRFPRTPRQNLVNSKCTRVSRMFTRGCVWMWPAREMYAIKMTFTNVRTTFRVPRDTIPARYVTPFHSLLLSFPRVN